MQDTEQRHTQVSIHQLSGVETSLGLRLQIHGELSAELELVRQGAIHRACMRHRLCMGCASKASGHAAWERNIRHLCNQGVVRAQVTLASGLSYGSTAL